MARKPQQAAGAPGWVVTFADLLAAVLAFFVMLAAFTTIDKKQLQLVAGSFREAFGMQKDKRLAGIVELNGIPTKPQLQNARLKPIDEASDITTPNEFRRDTEGLPVTQFDRAFALAAASLRQALNDMPEIAEISKNVTIEQTREGLNLSIMDQDGRSMFPDGSVNPYERTRRVLAAVAPTLRKMPNRLTITGHTSATRPGQRSGWSAWELSVGRAAAVREIMAASGLPDDRFAAVIGKADTDPVFPDNPYLAANRRISITVLHEAPPLPPGVRP